MFTSTNILLGVRVCAKVNYAGIIKIVAVVNAAYSDELVLEKLGGYKRNEL